MATILVVDDEPDIRSLLTDFLTPEGYVVQTAADGSEALHMVPSRAFDLALVDIWLPGMSGVELLKHLKDLAPEMPVVIITFSNRIHRSSMIILSILCILQFVHSPSSSRQ